MRVNLFTEPTSLDPGIPKEITSTTVILMLFEGLTRIDLEGKPSLAAAESVEVSEDGMIYTFRLRKNYWTNGDVVTAQHFARAWKRVLDPNFPSSHAYHLFIIKGGRDAKFGKIPLDDIGVVALDRRTLQVELEHPAPYFLDLVANTIFYPTYPGWAPRSEDFVSNGPFQLEEWEHHKAITVRKNPYYWDAENVGVERIDMVMIEDQNTELTMFEQGELDWAGSPLSILPFDALQTARENPGFHSLPVASTYWYQFNTNEPPFHNANIRKAFSYAIDRKKIVDHISHGTHEPANKLVPPLFHLNASGWENEDPKELFEKGLEELGLTRETFPAVSLSYNNGDDHKKIAQAIQQQWEETFEVPIGLREAEWGVHISRLRHGEFQVARGWWIAQFSDPIDFFNRFRFHTSVGFGANTGDQWERDSFVTILDAADLELDSEKREHLLEQAEEKLLDEAPVAPIFYITQTSLQSPHLHNVVYSSLGHLDFRWAYWADAHPHNP